MQGRRAFRPKATQKTGADSRKRTRPEGSEFSLRLPGFAAHGPLP